MVVLPIVLFSILGFCLALLLLLPLMAVVFIKHLLIALLLRMEDVTNYSSWQIFSKEITILILLCLPMWANEFYHHGRNGLMANVHDLWMFILVSWCMHKCFTIENSQKPKWTKHKQWMRATLINKISLWWYDALLCDLLKGLITQRVPMIGDNLRKYFEWTGEFCPGFQYRVFSCWSEVVATREATNQNK